MSKHDLNAAAFLRCVEPLLDSPQVNSMKQWRHHFSVTCYEHSLFVSYVAFRLARYLGWDYRAAARAGLLHDLYLYDPADRAAHPGNQCFDHPKIAAENAAKLTKLTSKEENIIRSHMWPLSPVPPRSPEAWLVDLVDTVCACLELTLANGEVVSLSVAADSCPNFAVNGVYYDYRPTAVWDSREFYECFDEIPWGWEETL